MIGAMASHGQDDASSGQMLPGADQLGQMRSRDGRRGSQNGGVEGRSEAFRRSITDGLQSRLLVPHVKDLPCKPDGARRHDAFPVQRAERVCSAPSRQNASQAVVHSWGMADMGVRTMVDGAPR